MKKKILIIAMLVAIIACIFVISSSASAYKAESTSIDMTISFYDVTENADGTKSYTEVKTTKKVDEIFNVSYKNDAEGYYFKLTSVKSWTVNVNGKDYNIKTDLAGLYLPEGITHVPDQGDNYWGFTSATAANVRKLHLPESLQDLGGNFLRGIGHIKLVNEDDTYDDYLPTSLVSVQDHLFCNWTLYNEIIYFPKDFHTIGTKTSTTWNFEGFSQVKSKITFVFLGKMTHIDFDTDERSSKPTFVFAANEASDLWGYELPMLEGSTTKASLSSYTYNNDSTKNTLSIFWITRNGINSSTDTGTQTVTISNDALSLIFCGGDKVQYSKVIRFSTNATSYPALVDANGAALSTKGSNAYGSDSWNHFYSSPIDYDMDAHATANKHYNSIDYQERNCGYDECTTYTCVICDLVNKEYTDKKATGEHTINDDFNCETALNCEVCKKTLAEAIAHVNVVTITYENGYIVAGKKITACSNEGCNHELSEEIDAIFTYAGFSLKTDDSGSICIGYLINEAVADEYALVNTSFAFGVVGYIPVDSESPLTVVDGKAVASEPQYTIQADITSQTMSAFDFVIAGFGTNTDVNLVMCAYVCDGTSVYYLNIDQTTNEVAQSTSATTFSYDGLKAYMDANEVA